MEQHDDHIWLTVEGKAWAIFAIERHDKYTVFFLWRGYIPNLEFSTLEFDNYDWAGYCNKAVDMLKKTWWR